MPETEITTKFLEAAGAYFRDEMNAREAADEAGLSGANRFFELLRLAYARNYICLNVPINQEATNKLRTWMGFLHKTEPQVVRGNPNDSTFYLRAAETFLIQLKLLLTSGATALKIGIVSGKSTADMIDRLIESGLWDEIIGATPVTVLELLIKALNATPVEGWELAGNANNSALKLAQLLRVKLPQCKVEPEGFSTNLVVPRNSAQDPQEGNGSDLDFVISGVGSPDSSVFRFVLNAWDIALPEGCVGDIAFQPVDREGHALRLMKGGVEHRISCRIDLETMRQMVERGKVVMVIARNSRKGESVRKTEAIRAVIRGNYANVLFTDEDTANDVVRKEYPAVTSAAGREAASAPQAGKRRGGRSQSV